MYQPSTHQLLKTIVESSPALKNTDADFLLRLSAQFQVIRSLAQKIYGVDEQALEKTLTQLVKKMFNANAERSASLQKIDHAREKNPHWFASEKLVGMMLYVDRFCGDLFTFKTKLPYFEDLGVNLIHLMPLLKCPKENNDGGYAVSDYRSVNPDLGTMDDMQEIAGQLHAKGMYLMLDLALNHTSDEHEWAQKALAGDKKYQNYYYMFESREVPDQFEKAMPQVFPDTAPGNFTYRPEINQWVMTVFHNYQWDLNYTNPEVFIEMLDNLLFLANQGVDVIRLDALAFMWKRPGTSCQNLDEAHLLIQLFKACTQVVAPGTLFLAEAIVAPHEIVRYFGQPGEVSNECDLAYHATLMTLLWETIATKNNRLLLTTLNHIPSKPNATSWLNYIRCHDDIGLGYEDLHASWAGYDAILHRKFIIDFFVGKSEWSFAKGEKFMEDPITGDARISGSLASLAGLEKALAEQNETSINLAIDRIVMLHSIILSFGGIPMFYMGDELGLTNDYSFRDHVDKKHDNRWMHRPKMDWNKAKLRSKITTTEGQIFSQLKRLVLVRKQTPEFADEKKATLIDSRNQHLFAYLREKGVFRTLCIVNLNDQPEPLYRDVLIQLGFDVQSGLMERISGLELDLRYNNYLLKPHACLWISQK